MCIIAEVPKNVHLSKKTLQACYDNNAHGWGIMWAEKGILYSIKDVTDFNDFLARWKDVPTNCFRAAHFRIRTHGDTNKENCHPFPVLSQEVHGVGLALMHNGIIQTAMKEKNMSDTFNFTKYELAPLLAECPAILNNMTFLRMLGELASNSRLLLMDNAGNRWFTGTWTKAFGCKFSNAYGYFKRASDPLPPLSNDYTHYSRHVPRNDGWMAGKIWSVMKGKYVWPSELNSELNDKGFVRTNENISRDIDQCGNLPALPEPISEQETAIRSVLSLVPRKIEETEIEDLEKLDVADKHIAEMEGMSETEIFQKVANELMDDPEAVTEILTRLL